MTYYIPPFRRSRVFLGMGADYADGSSIFREDDKRCHAMRPDGTHINPVDRPFASDQDAAAALAKEGFGPHVMCRSCGYQMPPGAAHACPGFRLGE